MPDFVVVQGDCLDVLKRAPDNSTDFVLTDPPYGLSSDPDIAEVMRHWVAGEHYEHHDRGGFMGKSWDSFVPGPDYWREVFRVLKPGAFAFVFAGTRTQDLMSISLRFAGFQIRDCIDWLYGTGFPKSRDVSKDLDAKAGEVRPVVGIDTARLRPNRLYDSGAIGNIGGNGKVSDRSDNGATRTAPVSGPAVRFSGFGTALKPAREPIIVAQKPLDGTYAENLLRWGVGALNIDASRIPFADGEVSPSERTRAAARARGEAGTVKTRAAREAESDGRLERRGDPSVYMAEHAGEALGRWPANVIVDDEVSDGIVEQAGEKARRFFYCAKVSKQERDVGCESLPLRSGGEATDRQDNTQGLESPRAGAGRGGGVRNRHPTVKPVRLLRYLIRLGCPPGGVILDPFVGSGSTGVAAFLEGDQFLGIELEEESAQVAKLRISAAESLREDTDP